MDTIVLLAEVCDCPSQNGGGNVLLLNDEETLSVSDSTKVFTHPKEELKGDSKQDVQSFDVDLRRLKGLLALPHDQQLRFVDAVARADYTTADSICVTDHVESLFSCVPDQVKVALACAAITCEVPTDKAAESRQRMVALFCEGGLNGPVLCAHVTRELRKREDMPPFTVLATQVESVNVVPKSLTTAPTASSDVPSLDDSVHISVFEVDGLPHEQNNIDRGSALAHRFHHSLRDLNGRLCGAKYTLCLFNMGSDSPKHHKPMRLADCFARAGPAVQEKWLKEYARGSCEKHLGGDGFKWGDDGLYAPLGRSFFLVCTVGDKAAHESIAFHASNLLEMNRIVLEWDWMFSVERQDLPGATASTATTNNSLAPTAVASALESTGTSQAVLLAGPVTTDWTDNVLTLQQQWLSEAKKRVDPKDPLAPFMAHDTVGFRFPDMDMARHKPELFKLLYPDRDPQELLDVQKSLLESTTAVKKLLS